MIRFNRYLLKEVNPSAVMPPLRRVIRMADTDRTPLLDLDEDAALRTILEGTATETGERNVNDRLEAERKIQSLTVQTEYLQEEIKELHNSDQILGRSQSLATVLRDVHQVAPTNATVLILGETGVGKELLARAIHSASPRRDRPLIK